MFRVQGFRFYGLGLRVLYKYIYIYICIFIYLHTHRGYIRTMEEQMESTMQGLGFRDVGFRVIHVRRDS